MSSTEGPIVFFDGVCGLCNRFVDFVIKRDATGRFLFAPLQGETAKLRVHGGSEPESFDSVLLWQGGRMYRRSEAALRVLEGLGGVWKVARLGRWLPELLRDGVYSGIARNRYRWFGKKDACRLPTPSERDRFLP